jgi:hypothetical protein
MQSRQEKYHLHSRRATSKSEAANVQPIDQDAVISFAVLRDLATWVAIDLPHINN